MENLRFLWISLLSRKFSSKFFLSYYKMFRITIQLRKFSCKFKEDHATAKLFHRERFALYSIVEQKTKLKHLNKLTNVMPNSYNAYS